MPADNAASILQAELGIKGWTRMMLRRKIEQSWKFTWVEGLHYFKSDRGLQSVNIDAIKRELIR